MANLKLYFFPGTSARVTMIALEELNVPYETQLLVFMRGEHKRPDYLKLNPKGKVPTLTIDGQPLTETLAILNYLNKTYPQAKLLPTYADPLKEALLQSDLAWLNSTVQPLITGVVLPQVFCAQPDAGRAQTWRQFNDLIKPHLDILEARLSNQPWLLGDTWSILDAHVWWTWDQALFGGFDGSGYKNLAAHAERSKARPSIQRAMQREGEAFGFMASQGINFDLPPPPKA
ncbi:MAG: glutathione S-transferase family protein [Steroidobacteraceae bacterium]